MTYTKPRASRIAMWNEKRIHSAVIQKQRLYDLQNCEIGLLPKKTWSKKYPICLEVKVLPLHVYPGNTMEVGEEATINVDADFPEEVSVPEDDDRRGSGSDEEVEVEDVEDEENRMTEEELEAKVKEELASSSLELLNQMDFDDGDEFQQYRDHDEIGNGNQETVRLCLFARTSRQKEVWFRRFVQARKYPEVDHEPLMENYLTSMKELMSLLPRELPEGVFSDQSILYSGINAIIHRVCFDLRRNPKIMEKIGRIIQKRLDNIKLPSVIEKFELSELDVGSRVPFIKHIYPPHLNEQGLWVEMLISFRGKVVAKVKTRVNLIQAVKRHSDDDSSNDSFMPPEESETAGQAGHPETTPEDFKFPEPPQVPVPSANSSHESKNISVNEPGANFLKPHVHFHGTSRKQKMLRFIEKLTTSKMFQRLSDSRVMHRAVANLANTDITMIVQLLSCDGTLLLNVPPPESDRLWYGFRGVPKMKITVQPYLGESRLTNRIVRRIMEASVRKAVQRLVVLPNMIEIPVPFLAHPNYDLLLCGIPCQHPVVDLTSRQSATEESSIDSKKRRSVTFRDEITGTTAEERGSSNRDPDTQN